MEAEKEVDNNIKYICEGKMLMAKYVVTDSYKPSYEKNYKLPLINIVPAVVWSIPIHEKLPDASWWMTFGCLSFVVMYVAVSFIPWAVIAPAVASVIIFSGLFWVFADYIGNQVVRIIVKIIIVAIFGLLEIGIFANATVPWLEGREANKTEIGWKNRIFLEIEELFISGSSFFNL